MSIIENNTNEKEKNSSLHFLVQLKDVINTTPNEELKVDEENINNSKNIIISKENKENKENKEENSSINLKEINNNNSTNDNIIPNNIGFNNEINSKNNQSEAENKEISEKNENLEKIEKNFSKKDENLTIKNEIDEKKE